MFPFPLQWDKVKDKEGDDKTIVLTPVQRALLLNMGMNIQYVGEKVPHSMNIGEGESDGFDAVISDLMSKLADNS
jgi:hypothetical protein